MQKARLASAVAAICFATVSSAFATIYEFPHVFELEGSAVGTPLGSFTMPYTGAPGSGRVDISTAPRHGGGHVYAYHSSPSFTGLIGAGSVIRLHDGAGETILNEEENLWMLHFRFRPEIVIGEISYFLPGDGILRFETLHTDSQPFPLPPGTGPAHEDLRHEDPLFFVFQGDTFFYPDGDDSSDSFVRLAPGSADLDPEHA